jgi:hypothetical protein
MDPKIIAGFRRLVLAVTGRPDDEDFLPLRYSDIAVVWESVESLEQASSGRSYANIIGMRFGLDGYGARTLKAIGMHYGVSAERIRQLEEKALRLLRHPSRSWKLRRLFRSVLENIIQELSEEKESLRAEINTISGERNQLWQELQEEKKKGIPEEAKTRFGVQLPEGIDVYELEFSPRLHNCLRNNGINTLGQLLQYTELELLRLKNFGRKTLNELKVLLSEWGYSLAIKIK